MIIAYVLLMLASASARQASTLSPAAAAVQRAWLAHDAQAIVEHSPNLVLQIPGADPSSPMGRAQAAELLRRYFTGRQERRLDISSIRELEADKGFVELERRYVVTGTDDERHETLFLGFRRQQGQWLLLELRSVT